MPSPSTLRSLGWLLLLMNLRCCMTRADVDLNNNFNNPAEPGPDSDYSQNTLLCKGSTYTFTWVTNHSLTNLLLVQQDTSNEETLQYNMSLSTQNYDFDPNNIPWPLSGGTAGGNVFFLQLFDSGATSGPICSSHYFNVSSNPADCEGIDSTTSSTSSTTSTSTNASISTSFLLPTTVASKATAVTTTTSAASTATSLTGNAVSNGGHSSSVAIGVGIGIGVCGAVMLITAGVLFQRYQKRKRAATWATTISQPKEVHKSQAQEYSMQSIQSRRPPDYKETYVIQTTRAELDNVRNPYHGGGAISELGTRHSSVPRAWPDEP